MRIASLLAAVVIVAHGTGCGSKPGPSPEPSVPIEPDSNSGSSAKAVYELDAGKHAIPASPVAGTLGGVELTPSVALEGDYLVFRTTKTGTNEVEREVLLRLRAGPTMPLPVGKRVVTPDSAVGPDTPEVMVTAPGKPITAHSNGYAMTLELEPRRAGKLVGKIYLCLPDAEKSVLAGSFVAAAPRIPTEPPGVEDVPFINGTVTVAGAAPGANLMTGYAASPAGPNAQIGIAAVDIDLARTEGEPEQWTERSDDKPRMTFLIAGDGKKVPSRFEHSRLPHGRYLAFAALKDGPIAWKWVDVGEKSTVAVPLAIDATKTGGLEVTVPLGSLAKVQLAPTDEQARVPMDPSLHSLIALQLRLEQDVVARKALFKHLGPGKYDVRDTASGQVRVVEIVAGKTVELDFDAKPVPPRVDPAPEPKPKG